MTPFQLLLHSNCLLKMGSLVIHLCAGGQSPCAHCNKLWRSIMCEEKQSCLAAAHRPCSPPPFFPVWKLLKNDIATSTLHNGWSLRNQLVTDVPTCRVLLTYRVWRFWCLKERNGVQKFEFDHKGCLIQKFQLKNSPKWKTQFWNTIVYCFKFVWNTIV